MMVGALRDRRKLTLFTAAVVGNGVPSAAASPLMASGRLAVSSRSRNEPRVAAQNFRYRLRMVGVPRIELGTPTMST